ncbi:MAG: sigma 54-interacting transcriptional regulator [Candidatus Sumerlaeota bacterium]|nr:sigma 54-interacting transcriptional regulator [Candidatus Sumerlaeota bacterium]
MSALLVIQGPNVGVKYRLDERTTIGRAPENTIPLPGGAASRAHCEIVRRGRSYTLYDRESRNGVLVNGKPVAERLLLRNDEIAIGGTVFLFNSDFDVKGVRFSNNLVYFSAPQDETIEAAPFEAPPPGEASGETALALAALRRLAALFAAVEDDFPRATQLALETVMALVQARRGCIMLWDEGLGELQPMAAAGEGEGEELAVSKQIVQTALREKRAILTSQVEIDYRYAQRQARPGDTPPSVLCVPMLWRDRAIGVLHFDGLRLESFRLDDVQLLQSVANLAAAAIHQAEESARRAREGRHAGPAPLLGSSPAFRAALEWVERVAPRDSPVLLTGETGTGKELIARAIHDRGPRAARPFVAVNCSAIPESLIESELFGHERGAFTGADRLALGKIEAAHGGTLFLDEIGEMSFAAQPKLLRFLQEKVFYRVGGSKLIAVDVRVIAATNADLRVAVEDGRFREDLFYRLHVATFDLPPLRERREDIRLLAEHFVGKHAKAMNRKILGIADEAMMALEKHAWPGNVRELENCIERAVLLSRDGVLDAKDFNLSANIAIPSAARKKPAENEEPPLSLREVEERAIRRALGRCGGHQARAADLLQIHRNTLRNKIQEYGIHVAEYET